MKRVKAFTLVELLVVISIVGLLVAILLPALNSAKQVSRQMACLNNLRQTVLALNVYADDYREQVPMMRYHLERDRNAWYTRLTPYLSDSSTVSENMYLHMSFQDQVRYNKIWEQLACPEQSLDEIATWVQGVRRTYGLHMATGSFGGSHSYDKGYGLVDWVTGATRRMSEITMASEVLAFADTRDVEYFHANFYVGLNALQPIYFPARHLDTYAGAFLDGHAEALSEDAVKDNNATFWLAAE